MSHLRFFGTKPWLYLQDRTPTLPPPSHPSLPRPQFAPFCFRLQGPTTKHYFPIKCHLISPRLSAPISPCSALFIAPTPHHQTALPEVLGNSMSAATTSVYSPTLSAFISFSFAASLSSHSHLLHCLRFLSFARTLPSKDTALFPSLPRIGY